MSAGNLHHQLEYSITSTNLIAMSTFDNCKALLPHPDVGCIHGPNAELTYKSIEDAAVQINANSTTIHSNDGDRKLGHLILAVVNTEYRAMSNGGVALSIPTATPINPVYPVNATGTVITETNRRNKEEVCVLHEYRDTDATLNHQLLGAVDNNYVVELKHTKIGYTNVTMLDLLSHFCDRCGTIKPEIMDTNIEKMTQPWECGTPFMKLTTKIEDGRAYVKAGNGNISDRQIVRVVFKLVTDTKQLDHACTEWRNKADADKDWPKSRKHFNNAHGTWKLTQTTGQYGFNKVNNAEQAPEWDQKSTNSVMYKLTPAFTNLAEATAPDRQFLANLAAAQAPDCT